MAGVGLIKGEGNKSEVGVGRRRMWTELGWRERDPLSAQKWGWTECGQDCQLHMSCYQGKSHQVVVGLVMIRAENIPFFFFSFFFKEEEVT